MTVMISGVATAGMAQTPTESEIAQAIQQGLAAKSSNSVRIDRSTDEYFVVLAGPLNRIANLALAAGRQYLPFTRDEVTDDALADQITVTALPKTPQNVRRVPAPVERIVISTRSAPPEITQAVNVEPVPAEWTNGVGARMSSQGLVATFPRDGTRDEFDVVIIRAGLREVRIRVDRKDLAKLK